MKSPIVLTVLAASLILSPRIVRAEEAGPNPVTHPVMAYDAHEVRADKKDVQKNETKLIETKQSMKERQAFLDQRKAEYEKSLKDNGGENAITKQALARYQDAEKSFNQSAHSHHKA